MQETRVLVETRGTTGEETISYWFELPIDVAEFEEKLGIGAESGDYRLSRLQKHDRCCKAKADKRPDVQTFI